MKLPSNYIKFIDECRLKDYTDEITHKHHVLPKFMGGTDKDDNLIELSVSDHCEAHKILAENVTEKYKVGAWVSLNLLKKYWDGDHQEILDNISKSVSGENNGMYGKTHKPEIIEQYRQYMSGPNNPMNNPDSVEKVRLSKIGKSRIDMMGDGNPMATAEYKNKMMKSIEDFHKSEEGADYRERMSKYTKENHPLDSKESKDKLSNSLKKRWMGLTENDKVELMKPINKKITCEVCGKTTNIGNYVRWHKNRCKK